MDCVIDLLTTDNYHIETLHEQFECLALAVDWVKARVGATHRNGSVVGKVKIHQNGDESEDDCITIER